LAKDLKQKWISQIKLDNKGSTIRNLTAGRVVDVPLGVINIPTGLSTKLWASMCEVYNSSQLIAIKYVCDQSTADQDTRVSLIQGPPGTGKTSTILGIISAFLFKTNDSDKFFPLSTVADINRKHILLCAPSNAAVDELLNRLQHGVLNNDGVKQSINIVRLGVPISGASTYIEELCLENQVVKALKLDSIWSKLQYVNQAILNLQNDIRQSSGTNFDNKIFNSRIRKVKSDLNDLYKSRKAYELGIEKKRVAIRHQIINEADIVAATLSGSGNKQFFDHILNTDHLSFETCIIDEAAQTTEPSTLIPLRYGCRRLVLVGDTRQLPATVLSINADNAGLSQSLFERLEKANHEVVMLSIQYRMHPDIRLFPSNYFYQGKLIDAPYITREVKEYNSNEGFKHVQHTIIPDFIKNSKLNSLNFYDLNSHEEKKFKSFINQTEIQFIISLLNDIQPLITDASIAIITPYKAQVKRLRELLKNNSIFSRLDINTIDGFQGREMDIVLFSCVRTCSSIGFLADERRMNVAITRAKKCLIIIGNADSLSNNETWKMMIDSIKERNMLTKVKLPYSIHS
jgi:senataxin